MGFAVQAADRGQPVRIDAATIGLVSREAGARALLLALSALAVGRRTVPARASAGVAERATPPVILLPGLTWRRTSLWPLRRFLVQRGWRWVWAIDRASADGTLAAEAEALRLAIAELRRTTGARQVDLVAFSAGGLVAAWYLRHLDQDRSVRRLVTLATPWRGTRLSVFGRGRAVEEVRFGSHVLDGLWPPPVPTTCLWSPDDTVVVPAESAAPSHAAEAVRIDGAGHVDLLLSGRAFRAVQAALEAPGPDPLPVAAPLASPTLIPSVLEDLP